MSRRTHFSITDMNDHSCLYNGMKAHYFVAYSSHMCAWYEYLSWSASSCNVRFNGIFEPSWLRFFAYKKKKNWATHKNLRSNRNGGMRKQFLQKSKIWCRIEEFMIFFCFLVPLLLDPLCSLSIVFNKL